MNNLNGVYTMTFFTIPGISSTRASTGYGTIMYNVSTGTTLSSCYPFFTSQSNLATLTSISSSGSGTISISDVDDYWTVMPGYKIILYNGTDYTSVIVTYDNTSGTVPVNYKPAPANTVASVQLYFKGTLIDKPL